MKTKAAVLYEPHTPLRIEEVDLGPVKAHDVLVKIVASGVCHSDLHVYHGQAGWPLPMVLGHEGAGIVQEVGSAVTQVQPGDHIIVNLAPYCGRCRECAQGFIYRCTVMRGPAGLLYDGETRLSKDGKPIHHYVNSATYAHHAIVHESSAIAIPKRIPLDAACLVGCSLPAGMGAVLNAVPIKPGSSVVVIGCGSVGLNVLQGAQLSGAGKIIAVDVLESKLATAREFGATDIIDASMENVVERVMELTGGGADYAYEVVGKVEPMMDAFRSIRRGGTAVMIGVAPDGSELPINPRELLQEKTITGVSFGSTRAPKDFLMYLDLYEAGKIKIDELITRRGTLEDINEAFADLEKGEVVRTVLLME